jgi:uncharacterized protein (DUF58 family)
MNLARLNHILIPPTKEGRDRLREGRLGRLIRPAAAAYHGLSEEGRVVFVLWLVNGAVAVNVRATQSWIVWAALAGLLLASWALRRRFALTGVRFRMRAPARVTVGETVQLAAELENDGDRTHHAVRIRGPLLPWDGRYLGAPPAVPTLGPGERTRAVVAARFTARGEHHLDPFLASALVPFGLAMGPLTASAGVRFVVVPRIAPVTRLRLPTGHRYQPGGVALASLTGESLEVTGLRPYRPGDPLRDLHARGWARRGEPVVREFRQEYFTRIGVVLDCDGAVADEAQLEAAISLTAGVVAHLTRGEALIDLLVIGDAVHRLTLGRSLGFLEQALDLLAGVRPGPRLAPAALLARLAPHLEQLTAVVFVTLAWDPPRQHLAREIAARGGGCRVLQVTPGGPVAPPAAVGGHAAPAGPDVATGALPIGRRGPGDAAGGGLPRTVLAADTSRAGAELAL